LIRPYGTAHAIINTLAVTIGFCAEPEVAGSLVSSDNNVVALANSNLKVIGRVRNDRDKIIGDDLKRVTVEVDTKLSVDGRVDKPKAVLLSRLNGNAVVGPATLSVFVGAVNKNIITRWWCAAQTAVKSTSTSLKGGDVVPGGILAYVHSIEWTATYQSWSVYVPRSTS
jgi:hypothetical protein